MPIREFKRVDCDGKDCTTVSENYNIEADDRGIRMLVEQKGWHHKGHYIYFCPTCTKEHGLDSK